MSLLANSNAIESGGYNIDRSLRFRSSASAYLNRTPASASNRKTFTWSAWIKLSLLNQYGSNFAAGNNNFVIKLAGASGSTYKFEIYEYTGSSYNFQLISTAVFRDPSAWYHMVVSIDTTQSTASNRVKVYINGTQFTALDTATYPSQNLDTYVNSTTTHYHGAFGSGYLSSGYIFDGYMTEINFIDGQALTPSSFGQTDAVTGAWTPKKYAGTYGTNGFYLPFSDNTSATTLAYDKSGNGNNWTPNNISTTAGATYDSMTDVPTLTSATAANYCTLNPLALRRDVATTVTFADGNLKATFNNAGGNTTHAWGTIAPTTGKFYWEITASAVVSNLAIGIGDQADQDGTANHSSIYVPAGGIYKYGTLLTTAASYTTNDVIGLAYDVDAGTLAYYKNNALQYTVTGLTYIPSLPFNRGSTSDVIIANFGQRPFSYTPPTGFKALNTFNLPDPTIKKPNQYMDATTFTGTGGAVTVTNAGGFQPDLVWAKGRSTAQNNWLNDSVRGAGNTLFSNLTNAEQSGVILTSFNSNGFTGDASFTNAATYVGWQWKKGATPGFDIVTWTCPTNNTAYTVNHSLGVAPKMMILKARNNATPNWFVYHESMGNTGYMALNLTNGNLGPYTPAWNNTSPTSTSFTAGTYWAQAAWNMVAYLFAEIPGFSKFGSYTGNGSADGPFVYCGFRPKYVLAKRSDSADGWYVLDSARNTYNALNAGLAPNDSGAEFATADRMDFTSNGFKLRVSVGPNQSGGTYIFAAFAENPMKFANAR